MSYARLMVHLELGGSNAALLGAACDLAKRSRASIVGVAACQPLAPAAFGGDYISGEAIRLDRSATESEAREAQAEFYSLLDGRVETLEWRCMETPTPLADYLAREARGVDLILTAPDRGGALLPDTRRVNVGDLVMRAGRPVLIVPAHATELHLGRVLVAWNDSREARRAALDALPLLEMTGQVTVVEAAGRGEQDAASNRLTDVAAWLKLHGILAETKVVPSHGDDVATLAAVARDQQADVIVAGAYGHSRLREWAFGGVTADLLLGPTRCVMLSH